MNTDSDPMRVIAAAVAYPSLVREAKKAHGDRDLAEVAAEVQMTLEDECKARDIDPVGGITILCLVIEANIDGYAIDERGEP